MIVGYARVSTRLQCFNGQLAELQDAGCAKVYSEKASGARRDRTELRKVIELTGCRNQENCSDECIAGFVE
jgi:DNA invertase Pin-like site-specific DNA recombinase